MFTKEIRKAINRVELKNQIIIMTRVKFRHTKSVKVLVLGVGHNNLTDESPGKRAKAFNKILAARHAAGRVE